MIWNQIVWWGVPTLALWLAGALTGKRWTRLALALSLAGWFCLGTFTALLWRELGRPPIRTLGETRLLYSFVLAGLGIGTAWRSGYAWLLAASNLLASVFLAILMARPGMQSSSALVKSFSILESPSRMEYWVWTWRCTNAMVSAKIHKSTRD